MRLGKRARLWCIHDQGIRTSGSLSLRMRIHAIRLFFVKMRCENKRLCGYASLSPKKQIKSEKISTKERHTT